MVDLPQSSLAEGGGAHIRRESGPVKSSIIVLNNIVIKGDRE